MSGIIKSVKKVFKKVAKVVKKIIKPVAIAVAAYFTAGLALSYIPATQAFAASLPGFGMGAGGTATGIFSKVATNIGLGGGLQAGAAKAAGTAVASTTAGSAGVAELGGLAGKTALGGATSAGASAPVAAKAGMSLADKLLLAKIGTDVGGALFGPTPQEVAEAEAIEAAKFRGSYYGMEASGATAPTQPAPLPPQQQLPISPEQQQLQAGRAAREELFPQAQPKPTQPGMTTGPGKMQQQLTPPPGLFAPAENVRYV